MSKHEYSEAFDIVLDWKDAQEHELNPQQQIELAEAEAQITAYTGRSYGDIRIDIARCAVARLDSMQQPTAPDNVMPLRNPRSELFASTKYIATTSVVNK
jgi:hypothetical protein